MRSTPQLPLATPEAGPEKIIRKGKTSQEGTSAVVPGISGIFYSLSLENLVSSSHSPVIPYVGVSRSLKFGSVPVDFFPPGLSLVGESFYTPFSPEVVPWFKPRTLEDFPTPGFATPPPIRVDAFTEGETYVPSSPVASSPNPQLFPRFSQKHSPSLTCSNSTPSWFSSSSCPNGRC
jgi:hypothetical protein